MQLRIRPSEKLSAILINNCRVQAVNEFFNNSWRHYHSRLEAEPYPYTEIEIDSRGTLYRYVQPTKQRINVDKELGRKKNG